MSMWWCGGAETGSTWPQPAAAWWAALRTAHRALGGPPGLAVVAAVLAAVARLRPHLRPIPRTERER